MVIAGGPSDADAVRTTERRWLDAEFHGDTAALHQILLPEYRSVSWKGVKDRQAIFASALRHSANHDAEPAYVAPDIEVHGATALSTFTVPDTSYSVDVFVLEHGSWHAIYSQHTLVTH
jgi:hypothetical protein